MTGTPCAADLPSLYQIWRKNVDRRQNYGRKSKFKMAAVSHLGFSKNRLLNTGTPWSADLSRPPKGTSLAETALTCQFLCRSVTWCDLCVSRRNQKKRKTRNKSNDYFESRSQCCTGRMCVTLPIITSLAIHVVQKITIIHERVQKIGKFAV